MFYLKHILTIAFFISLLSSCTIHKRRYREGLFISTSNVIKHKILKQEIESDSITERQEKYLAETIQNETSADTTGHTTKILKKPIFRRVSVQSSITQKGKEILSLKLRKNPTYSKYHKIPESNEKLKKAIVLVFLLSGLLFWIAGLIFFPLAIPAFLFDFIFVTKETLTAWIIVVITGSLLMIGTLIMFVGYVLRTIGIFIQNKLKIDSETIDKISDSYFKLLVFSFALAILALFILIPWYFFSLTFLDGMLSIAAILLISFLIWAANIYTKKVFGGNILDAIQEFLSL